MEGGVAVITSPSGGTRVPTQDLVPVALRGLAACGLTPDGEMPFTLRGAPGPDGPEVHPEGHSLRYTAIAALGLARQPEDIQRDVLGGPDAAELARSCLTSASTTRAPGRWVARARRKLRRPDLPDPGARPVRRPDRRSQLSEGGREDSTPDRRA